MAWAHAAALPAASGATKAVVLSSGEGTEMAAVAGVSPVGILVGVTIGAAPVGVVVGVAVGVVDGAAFGGVTTAPPVAPATMVLDVGAVVVVVGGSADGGMTTAPCAGAEATPAKVADEGGTGMPAVGIAARADETVHASSKVTGDGRESTAGKAIAGGEWGGGVGTHGVEAGEVYIGATGAGGRDHGLMRVDGQSTLHCSAFTDPLM